MNLAPLTPSEIATALAELRSWTHEGNSLNRSIRFPSFLEAMRFMVCVGLDADAMNHHPEWTNVHDRVDIRLTTHDAGGKVTALDLDLARRIQHYLKEWQIP